MLKRALERQRQTPRDYIVVSRERQTRKLFLDSVRYFEIWGRQIEVHEEHEVFTWYEQIGALESSLRAKDFSGAIKVISSIWGMWRCTTGRRRSWTTGSGS